eukprot:37669-Chlamydomonas_euryale.AAC.2
MCGRRVNWMRDFPFSRAGQPWDGMWEVGREDAESHWVALAVECAPNAAWASRDCCTDHTHTKAASLPLPSTFF